MNQHDRRDQEVRNYVRNRMAGEIPPEFVGSVMHDVQRTSQRRRGPAWPIFTGLATVAAAAVIVIVGLGLIDRDDVGSQPTPSPTTAASPTPGASASVQPTPTPSPAATTGVGEFGPIHSMAPEDAFPNAQTCETGPILANAETFELSYRIAFPEAWHTNEMTDDRSACTLFAPVALDDPDDHVFPGTVAISVDLSPGGDFGAGGSSVTTEEYTVDGVAAVRYDIAPTEGGFVPTRTVSWIIAIAGALPAEGNDRPYLIMSTTSADADELAQRIETLDRMVSTLDIGEE